jgi:hypothetical protein
MGQGCRPPGAAAGQPPPPPRSLTRGSVKNVPRLALGAALAEERRDAIDSAARFAREGAPDRYWNAERQSQPGNEVALTPPRPPAAAGALAVT